MEPKYTDHHVKMLNDRIASLEAENARLRAEPRMRWVNCAERIPIEKAFWNIEGGAQKDCTFPVRSEGRYYMGEIFDQRMKDETEEKLSIYFNHTHHFKDELHRIEWLEEHPTEHVFTVEQMKQSMEDEGIDFSVQDRVISNLQH